MTAMTSGFSTATESIVPLYHLYAQKMPAEPFSENTDRTNEAQRSLAGDADADGSYQIDGLSGTSHRALTTRQRA